MGCTIGTLNVKTQERPELEYCESTTNVLMQDQQHDVVTKKRQRQLLNVQTSEHGDVYSNWQDASGKRMSKELVIDSRDRMCQYIPEKISPQNRSYLLHSPMKKNTTVTVFTDPYVVKRRSVKRKFNRDNNNSDFKPSMYTLPRAQMITLADFD